MLEVIGASLAVKAVDFILGKPLEKAAEAIAQSAANDLYKVSLKKLKLFFADKFYERPELENVKANPEDLVKAVENEIQNNKEFEQELSKLVLEHEKSMGLAQDNPINISQGDNGTANINSNLQNVDQSRNSAGDSGIAISGGATGNIDNRRGSFRS